MKDKEKNLLMADLLLEIIEALQLKAAELLNK